MSDDPIDPRDEEITELKEQLTLLQDEYNRKVELHKQIEELEARRQQLESEFRRNPEQRTYTVYTTFTEREVRSIDFANLQQLCVERLMNALERFRHESPELFRGKRPDRYLPYGYNPTDPKSLGTYLGIPIPSPPDLDPEMIKALLGPINKNEPMKFRIGMDYSPKIIPNPGIIKSGET